MTKEDPMNAGDEKTVETGEKMREWESLA